MTLIHWIRRMIRQFTGQSSLPPYTYTIGDSMDFAAMHSVRLTPRQWAVIRHVLIAAGERDPDVHWRSSSIVQALGQNLEYWEYDSDDDQLLIVAPELVLLIGETLAAYQEGRVTFPDEEALDEWYIDLGDPVTAESVERTLVRLGEQTAVVHTRDTESTDEESMSQPSSSASPRHVPTDG